MTIGQRIKQAREQAGITQVALGEKVGVSGVAIMRYEKDTRQPRLEQLARISRVLGTTLYELVGPDYFSSYTQEELSQMWQEVPFEETVSARKRINAILDKLNNAGTEKAADVLEIIAGNPLYVNMEHSPKDEGGITSPTADE